jgi:hypothetical protein
MRFVGQLRSGLAGGRGTGSMPISTRYDGPGVNAQKYGPKQSIVGETNYASSNKGIASSGSY